MIVAIISDLHGNLPACNAVLNDADQFKAQEYWCLGDVVGYTPWPFQVWQRLSHLNIPTSGWVAGNHDWALTGRLDGFIQLEVDGQKKLIRVADLSIETDGHRFDLNIFNSSAAQIIKMQRQSLPENSPIYAVLDNLPIVASPRPGVYLTHGRFTHKNDMDNVIQYTFEQEEVQEGYKALQAGWSAFSHDDPNHIVSEQGWRQPCLLFVGHTHSARMWHRRLNAPGTNTWDRQPISFETWIELGNLAEQPVLINPGSVGWSRDTPGWANYVLLNWSDSQCPRVHFRQVRYDYEFVLATMRERGYPIVQVRAGGTAS